MDMTNNQEVLSSNLTDAGTIFLCNHSGQHIPIVPLPGIEPVTFEKIVSCDK